jgi:hypothetical protein
MTPARARRALSKSTQVASEARFRTWLSAELVATDGSAATIQYGQLPLSGQRTWRRTEADEEEQVGFEDLLDAEADEHGLDDAGDGRKHGDKVNEQLLALVICQSEQSRASATRERALTGMPLTQRAVRPLPRPSAARSFHDSSAPRYSNRTPACGRRPSWGDWAKTRPWTSGGTEARADVRESVSRWAG